MKNPMVRFTLLQDQLANALAVCIDELQRATYAAHKLKDDELLESLNTAINLACVVKARYNTNEAQRCTCDCCSTPACDSLGGGVRVVGVGPEGLTFDKLVDYDYHIPTNVEKPIANNAWVVVPVKDGEAVIGFRMIWSTPTEGGLYRCVLESLQSSVPDWDEGQIHASLQEKAKRFNQVGLTPEVILSGRARYTPGTRSNAKPNEAPQSNGMFEFLARTLMKELDKADEKLDGGKVIWSMLDKDSPACDNFMARCYLKTGPDGKEDVKWVEVRMMLKEGVIVPILGSIHDVSTWCKMLKGKVTITETNGQMVAAESEGKVSFIG